MARIVATADRASQSGCGMCGMFFQRIFNTRKHPPYAFSTQYSDPLKNIPHIPHSPRNSLPRSRLAVRNVRKSNIRRHSAKGPNIPHFSVVSQKFDSIDLALTVLVASEDRDLSAA